MSAPFRPAARTRTSSSPVPGTGSGCSRIASLPSSMVTARIGLLAGLVAVARAGPASRPVRPGPAPRYRGTLPDRIEPVDGPHPDGMQHLGRVGRVAGARPPDGGVDEDLHQAAVDALDLVVVAGRLADRAQQRTVLRPRAHQPGGGLAALDERVAATGEPAGGGLEQLGGQVAEQPDDQVLTVLEVAVEGGPGLAGGRHDVVDRKVPVWALAKQRLRRVEDLALGLLTAPAAAVTELDPAAGGHGRSLADSV